MKTFYISLIAVSLLVGFSGKKEEPKVSIPTYDKQTQSCPYAYSDNSEYKYEGDREYQHCYICRAGILLEDKCTNCGKKFGKTASYGK